MTGYFKKTNWLYLSCHVHSQQKTSSTESEKLLYFMICLCVSPGSRRVLCLLHDVFVYQSGTWT